MKDSPTLRTPESYLDEVAREELKNSFNPPSSFKEAIEDYYPVTIIRIVHEAMRRMCEDAFKAQKEICADAAKTIWQDRDNDLNPCTPYIEIDKSSILNAPTPFDNQNKN